MTPPTTTAPPARLLVIRPAGALVIETRDHLDIPAQVAEHIPAAASQGHGALRWWYPEAPATVPNPLACLVTASLGYSHKWNGPLVVSAEATGPDAWPPIPSAALRAIRTELLEVFTFEPGDPLPALLAELAERAEALGH